MYIDKLGFDPDTVPTLSFGELLKRIGPGIILTGVVIGPGAITTASMLGANMATKCFGSSSPFSSWALPLCFPATVSAC